MSEYQTIGKSIQSAGAASKVSGRALYATDLSRPDMLYGKILYSDRPHARILNIDNRQAEALTGVKAVITSANAPGRHYGIYIKDRLIFAVDRVRHIGEPVAAVAATDQKVAAEAIRLIKVEYVDLPSVHTIEDAMAPDAHVIHPNLAEYQAIYPYKRSGNVCMDAQLSLGDVEAGFSEADQIIEGNYYTSPTHHVPLEPHACLAEVDFNGRITVYTGTQQLSVLHTELALALDLPMTDVKVVPVWLGGGFGGRLKTQLEPICSLLACQTRLPVKIVLNREEEFLTAHARAPFSIYMKVGVMQDGTIIAKETDVLVDAGAYTDHVIGTATHAITIAQGPYHIPNCHSRARVVVTNNPDWGCMRGYGAQQIAFATELIMDDIASKLGMDPVDLRLNNLCRDGEPILSTQNLRAVTIRETMEAALKESGYWEKKSKQEPNCGIGVANSIHVTGFLSSSAMVRVNEDATVSIITGVSEIGCGSHNILRQIVAEVLGVSVDRVSVVAADSDFAPYDTGSIASRTTYDSGNAARLAAEEVREKLVAAAAPFLNCDQGEIGVKGGWVFQQDKPDNRLAFKDIVGIALYVQGGPLLGSGSWLAAGSFPNPVGEGYSQGPVGTFLFGTHVAEVEVDPETGKTRIINYTACHDVGKALNPAGVEGQIEGGVVQGIGGSLFEELLTSEGKITNSSLVDYRLPTVLDLPPIKAVYLEYPDPTGPFGAKGVGEPPIIPPAPAIANAIFDATGVQIKKIPITAERLQQAISTQTDQ